MTKLFPRNGNDQTPGQGEKLFSFSQSVPQWFYVEKVKGLLQNEYHFKTGDSYEAILEDILKKVRMRIREKKLNKMDSNYAREKFASMPIEHLNIEAEEKLVDTFKRCVKIWRDVMKSKKEGSLVEGTDPIDMFFALAQHGPHKLPETHRYILAGWEKDKNSPQRELISAGAASLLVKLLVEYVPWDSAEAKRLWAKEKELIKDKNEYMKAQREATLKERWEIQLSSPKKPKEIGTISWEETENQQNIASEAASENTTETDSEADSETTAPDTKASSEESFLDDDDYNTPDDDLLEEPYIDNRWVSWKDGKPAWPAKGMSWGGPFD